MKKRKGTKTSKSAVGKLFSSVLFSFLLLIPVSLLSGGILLFLKNPVGSMKVASLAVLLISAAISGFSNSKRCGDGGIIFAIVSSFVFVLIMFSVSLVATKGHVSGVLFMNYVCYMLVSSLFAFLAVRRKGHKRRR